MRVGYTMGPWRVVRDPCHYGSFSTVMAGPHRVAEATGHRLVEVEANARLIAAAPDLYETACAVIEQWDTPNWKLTEPTGKLIAALRSAIAKATP